MFHLLEKIKVAFMVKLVWRLLPSKKIEMIRHYESTEDDSAWQLLWGMKHMTDPKQQAELFAQAMEEAHHAELFRELYQRETNQKLHKAFYPKKALYTHPEDMWKLFVYCLVGEESAAQRFDLIARNLEQGPMKTTLNSIVSDEVGHIHKAKELIKVEGQTPKRIERELRRIKRMRFQEAWLRSGRQITNAVTDLLLSLLYFFIVPVFCLAVAKPRDRSPS